MTATSDALTPPAPPAQSPAQAAFWTTWALIAAFGTYFCMYGFRKPFTAASYADTQLWGVGFKAVLIIAQVIGYTISKFIGIRVISEMPPRRRALALVSLIAVAELALVLYGLTPRPWNAFWLFVNGLPLGMVFGLVLGYLEGRRVTEVLTAGLCVSFVVAGGVSKSAGAFLLERGISEDWMPALAGLIFLPGLLIGTAMLQRIPKPTAQDIDARTERTPLLRHERRALFRRYALGLTLITAMYLALTVIRSLRDDFAPELFKTLGEAATPATFSSSELLVALAVIAANAAIVFFRDNRIAFFASLAICFVGLAALAGGLIAQSQGLLSPFAFMVVTGLGMYLPYIAVQTTVFERLIAMTREKGNLGFLVYVADSFGYLGYVAVLLSKSVISSRGDILTLYIAVCWTTVVVAGISLLGAWWYFAARRSGAPTTAPTEETAAARISGRKLTGVS